MERHLPLCGIISVDFKVVIFRSHYNAAYAVVADAGWEFAGRDLYITRGVKIFSGFGISYISVVKVRLWLTGSTNDSVPAERNGFLPGLDFKALIGKIPADGQVAAADGVVSCNVAGNLHLADSIFPIEGDAAPFRGRNAAHTDAVSIDHRCCSLTVQAADAAAVDRHIAAAGQVQFIRVSCPFLIESGHIGYGAAAGDMAAGLHIENKVLSASIVWICIGFDLTSQFQRAGYIQRAELGRSENAVLEGLHQQLGAFLQLQYRVGRNVQNRGKERGLRFFCRYFVCGRSIFINARFHSYSRCCKKLRIIFFFRRKAVMGFCGYGRIRAVVAVNRSGGCDLSGDPHIQGAAVGNHQSDARGDGVLFIQNAGDIAVNQFIHTLGRLPEHGDAAVGIDCGVGQQVQIGALQHIDLIDEQDAGAGDVHIAVGIKGADAVEACQAEVNAGTFGMNLQSAVVIDHADSTAVIAPAGAVYFIPAYVCGISTQRCIADFHNRSGGLIIFGGSSLIVERIDPILPFRKGTGPQAEAAGTEGCDKGSAGVFGASIAGIGVFGAGSIIGISIAGAGVFGAGSIAGVSIAGIGVFGAGSIIGISIADAGVFGAGSVVPAGQHGGVSCAVCSRSGGHDSLVCAAFRLDRYRGHIPGCTGLVRIGRGGQGCNQGQGGQQAGQEAFRSLFH